jgi:hypothetical protein
MGAVTAKSGGPRAVRSLRVRLSHAEPSFAFVRTHSAVRTVSAGAGESLLRRWSSRVVAAAAVFCLCALPRTSEGQELSSEGRVEEADASTSPDYDKLLDRAVEAFDAQDYAKARELFEQAYGLRPNARVLRGLGISALHLERFTVSKRELTEALTETKQPLTANQREGVKELLSWMQLNLGTLQLRLQPKTALVTLDDEPVTENELVVKPGSHHAVVTAEGYFSQERTVELAAGQTKSLNLSLSKNLSETTNAPSMSVTDVAMSAFMAGGNASLRSPDDDFAPLRDQESTSVFERWWFWTAVGVVVAGGVATTVALTSSSPSKSFERGGLGGVIMPLGRMP